jgi:hypothetical protein
VSITSTYLSFLTIHRDDRSLLSSDVTTIATCILPKFHTQSVVKSVPLHAIEALGGERRYSSYSSSTSALDGGEWSASRPGRALTPGERTLGTHGTGGWVGPRAGLDTEARGKILCPRRESNPDRPVVQPVVRHYTA